MGWHQESLDAIMEGEKMPKENKSLAKGGVYYLVYNIINLAFPFITGVYVARKLLPDGIGAVTAAQNVAQYFVILAFLGIPTYGMREIAKTRDNFEERSKIFSELFIINLISTCFFLVCYILLVLLVPQYNSSLKLYLIVGISIAINAFNISWLYEGLEEFRFISLRNILFKITAFLLLVIFVRNPDDYYKYAAITVVGTAGNSVVNMLLSPRFIKFTYKNLRLKKHMKSICYLVAVNLAIELYSLVDITMMNYWCNNDSIAFYKYGHQILKILLQVVNTFTMVLIPRISYYYKEKRINDFNQLVSKAYKLIILCSLPMIIGIIFTSDFLITKMYGAAFINSARILQMFAILLLVSPTGYLLGSRMLLVTNHENKMIISVGTGAVVNIIGNLLLIPNYAEYGATLASIISEFVVMGVYVYMGKKYFKFVGVKKTAVKVIIASLVMCIFLLVINFSFISGWIKLFIQIIGSIIIYSMMLFVLKEETFRQYLLWAIKKVKK